MVASAVSGSAACSADSAAERAVVSWLLETTGSPTFPHDMCLRSLYAMT